MEGEQVLTYCKIRVFKLVLSCPEACFAIFEIPLTKRVMLEMEYLFILIDIGDE
jgi:hypothetical protein